MCLQWFEDRKNGLETLESGLKVLLKSVEAIIKQRKGTIYLVNASKAFYVLTYFIFADLGSTTSEFGESMLSLAKAEPNQALSKHMTILGALQQKIKELHDKQVWLLSFFETRCWL
jgi:sorting nexin-1/2